MGLSDVASICEKYLGRREEREKVVEILERCIKKGYDYEKMKERVLSSVSDSVKAHKVISLVCEEYPQFRKRKKFEETNERDVKRERSDRDRERDRDSGRERERDRGRGERENKDRDRERSSRNIEEDIAKQIERDRLKIIAEQEVKRKQEEELARKNAPITEDALRAKEAMYLAQQAIEERKRKLAGPVLPQGYAPPTTSAGKNMSLGAQEAKMLITRDMELRSKVEELKAKVAAKVAKVGAALPTPSAGVMIASLPPVIEKPKEEPKLNKVKKEEEQQFLEYLDPRIGSRPADRQRRMFNFHDKGEFERLANKQRATAKLEKLQSEISHAAKSTGISSAVKLAMVTPAGRSVDSVPDVEWWDSVVLETENYDDIPEVTCENRYSNTITDLIEHPIKLKPPNEPLIPQYLKVYLTKKERRKIRRQNRKEMQKEKTEKIRLGLEKAPEPKVKISNLMKVLTSDAIQDPTKMEAHVRKQMADRLKKHEDANQERKLTKAQKSAKKAKKIAEDTSLAVNVAIYKLKSLTHPSKKFKVETNAKQLGMTGVIMLSKLLNVVVVEGGPKQQKFFKNLMLTRIKWEDEIIGQKKDAEKDAPGERNQCQLIWEGQVKRRSFRDMSVVTATIEKQARDYFERHAVAQYWDLAYSTCVLLDAQEETEAV